MKLQNKSDRLIFLKLLRSYALLVLVPIIVLSIVVIYGVLAKVERDINGLNETIFNQCQSSLDKNLRSINSMMYQMTESGEILEFICTGYPEGAVRNFAASKAIKKIKEFQTANTIFSKIAIYSKENNVIIDGSDMYKPERFFSEFGENKENWLNISKISKCKQYEDYLIYSHNLTGALNEDDKIIVLIKLTDIFKMFDILDVNGEWGFIVADRMGNVLVNSNLNIPLEKLPEFQERKGRYIVECAGEKFNTSYNFSGVDNLVYACLVSKNGMSGNTQKLLIAFVLVVLACLGGCLWLAYYNTRKSYFPLKETMDTNKTLSENIEQMSGVIKKGVLLNLLRGLYRDDEKEGLVENYKKRLSGPFITVAAVGVRDYSRISSLIASREVLKPVMDENAVMFEMISIDEEHDIYVLSHDIEDIPWVLETAMKRLPSQVRDGLNIALGETVSNLFKLNTSYDAALFALNHAFRKGVNMQVLMYDRRSGGNDIDFSADKKLAVVECVKAGDCEKVETLLSGIWQTNFIERQLDHNLLATLINRLSVTLLEILDGFFIKNAENYREYVDICTKASKGKDLFLEFDLLKGAFLDLSKEMKNYQMEKSESRIDEILEFIHENYFLQDMSLGLVSDKFYINYQYLSKLFIAKTGRYFVDYLNLYRLEKSKEFLEKTQYKVEEIAKKVGFTSGNSYIRTFKKYYEITPGQYKKNAESKYNDK